MTDVLVPVLIDDTGQGTSGSTMYYAPANLDANRALGVNGGSLAYAGQTWNPLIARLRDAALGSPALNSIDLGVMSAPPTITTGTTTRDATLTKNVYVASGGVPLSTAACFKYRGGTPAITSSVYYRFPVITLPTGTGNATATQNANGWAVEFVTDAPKVELVVLCSNSTRGLQVEVDNYLVSASVTALPASSGSGFILLDFTTVGARKVRKIRVEGDQATGWRGVNVAPTAGVWSYEPHHEIVAAQVGDSIPSQTGATNPNGGYDIAIGKLLGWTDVRQVSVGGSGFTVGGANASTFDHSQRIADVVAVNPDILMIGASTNDATPGATLRARMLSTLQAYRAAVPNALMLVTGIWPGASGPGANQLSIEADMLSSFNTWGDTNSFYVPYANDPEGAWVFGTGHVGATNASGNSDFYVNSVDLVHPSQEGHDYTAKRFANAFRQKFLQVRA